MVVADAEGVDGPGQAVLGDLPDVVVVQVEPEQPTNSNTSTNINTFPKNKYKCKEQPLEAAEEIVRQLNNLVVAEKQGRQRVPEAEEVAVRQGGDLVPEIYLWDKYSFLRIDGSNSQIEG